MAAPYNPPVKNEDFAIYVAFENNANPGSFKSNPTLAVGDVKVTIDGAALANLSTSPIVSPASSIWVNLTFAASEMNGDVIGVQCIDQTSPKEWLDLAFAIPTTSA